MRGLKDRVGQLPWLAPLHGFVGTRIARFRIPTLSLLAPFADCIPSLILSTLNGQLVVLYHICHPFEYCVSSACAARVICSPEKGVWKCVKQQCHLTNPMFSTCDANGTIRWFGPRSPFHDLPTGH